MVWSAPNGDIHVDRLVTFKSDLKEDSSIWISIKLILIPFCHYGQVKLYDLASIHCHQIEVDCRGPKSPWFGLVDPKEIPVRVFL